MAILKIPRFWPVMQASHASAKGNAMGVGPVAQSDGLDAFGSETEPVAEPRTVEEGGNLFPV